MNNKTACQMYDVACEKVVIGTMMNYDWAFPLVSYCMRRELFSDPLCVQCVTAMLALQERRVGLDFINVTAEIHKEHPEIQPFEVIELTNSYLHNEGEFMNHVGRLNDLFTRRRIFNLGIQMMEEGNSERMELDELVGMVVKAMQDIAATGLPAGTSTLADTMEELERFFYDRQEGKLEEKGTLTGFDELDEGGGLTAGQLNIIAGATSHGKTSFALALVDQALQQEIPVAFFSLEMGRRELGARFLAMQTGISSSKQLHPTRLPEIEEFNQLMGSAQVLKVRGTNLIFDDHFSSSIDHICGAIRSMHYRYNIKGAVVDYLQILGTNKHVNNREQLMGEVARQLKNLAVELGIWVLALSQLNRDGNAGSPNIDRLRDSGQIAEAADRVMILFRPEANGTTYPKPFGDVDPHHTAMLNVVKNRNGSLSKFIMGFTPESTLFAPIHGALPLKSLVSSNTLISEAIPFKQF